MRFRTLTALPLLILCSGGFAQGYTVSGDILDETAGPLTAAVAVLLNPADSTLLYFSVTGNSGKFEMKNVRKGKYLLQASLLGYKTVYLPLEIPQPEENSPLTLIMMPKTFGLGEVSVTSDMIPMKIKNDTIEYNAKAFKVKTDAVAEDLIKELPGMEVDRAGNIKAMGEDVNNVLVDGKEFFGNDPKVATRNLPADAIDKVQLFDRQSDESRFTGIDDGERNPTLNIMLGKDKKKGVFGDIQAGYGTGDRGEASGKMYRFSDRIQLAGLAMFNNVNNFGFSVGDYINFSGGISSFTSGGGHIMLEKGSSFPVNFGQPVYGSGSNGAAGLNFSLIKSQDNRFFMSYLGNGSRRRLSETSRTWNFIPESTYLVDERKNELTSDSAHRFSFGIRQRFGEKQNLIINGGFTLNSSSNPMNSVSSGFLNDLQVNALTRDTHESASGLSGNTDASYQVKLKEGKTILRLSGRINYSGNKTSSAFLNSTEYFDPYLLTLTNQFYNLRSSLQSYAGTASFTQRTSERSFIDASLSAGYSADNLSRTQGNLEGSSAPVDSLSPGFLKVGKYLRPALTWKLSTSKSKLTLSMAAVAGNYTTFLDKDNGIGKDYFFLLPRASWEFEYRSGRRLMADYSASAGTPASAQLLPVVNNLNSLSLYYGNRYLKPEYISDARLSWWLFDQFSFTTLLTGLNLKYTRNKIGYDRRVNGNMGQTVTTINAGDEWQGSGSVDFSTPVKPLGMKINLSLNESYSRGTGIVNGTENISASMVHRISLTLDNRKKDKWDISTGSAATVTDSRYSVQNSLNNVYYDISWFSEIRFTPGKHLSMMTSADITNYSAKTFNDSRLIPLVGASISYYFLKYERGALTISAVDILNRNTGIERSGELNFLTERQSAILGRYFMLSFKYRLNKTGDTSGGVDIKIRNR